jgi:hypothetical protein
LLLPELRTLSQTWINSINYSANESLKHKSAIKVQWTNDVPYHRSSKLDNKPSLVQNSSTPLVPPRNSPKNSWDPLTSYPKLEPTPGHSDSQIRCEQSILFSMSVCLSHQLRILF